MTGAADAAQVILRRRVAPTAHHVTPTNGPGFLAADWIASAGGDEPVVVLAWSGVSLSNTAWSGCLSFTGPLFRPGSPTAHRMRKARADRQRDAGHTEERVWLFPARQRDALLYRLPIPERLPAVLDDLLPAAAAVLPAPAAEDFPTWALRACAAVQQTVLDRPLVYLDLNRLMADYLSEAMRAPGHPLAVLMASPGPLAEGLPGMSWLYARRGRKVASLVPDSGGFAGRGVSVSADAVEAGLREGTLCPGLVPSFAALTCLNPIRCLGSFNQVRYLTALRTAWGAPPVRHPTLVAGRAALPEGQEAYPLDLLMSGTGLRVEGVRMGDLWARLLR